MELLQLRYFQKVAEFENVTKAAKYFQVPQPAMSQTISRLERDLGVKLFERQNGKLYLNEKGRTFLGTVENILRELDEGVEKITETPTGISGSVSIKITENHRFILTCIPKFSKLYPDVRISASHGYYEDTSVTYDLCISSQTVYKQMTAHTPLIREKIVLAVHRDHPFAQKRYVEIADLKGEKLISLPAQSSLYARTLELCHAQGFEPLIPIICDDPYYIRKYVSENMGVALAPEISWRGRFRENTVLVPIKNPEIYICSYLLWDNSHYLTPAVCKFRDFLLDEVKAYTAKSYTARDIRNQLETFRMAVGHHVHIHSSLKAVGEVEGRGEGLLSCLIDYFTKDGGMVSFPTHTWNTNVLDLRETETCMGMLSRLALERGDGVRTVNPTHSMVIFGEQAESYAKWDEEIHSSVSPEGCYGRLYEADGYVLLLGVGQDKNTYIHAAEECLNIPERVTEPEETWLIDQTGQKVRKQLQLVYEEKGDISEYFGKLEPAFRYHHCIVDGRIGDALVQLCSVRGMMRVLELIHERSKRVELFLDDREIPVEWYIE